MRCCFNPCFYLDERGSFFSAEKIAQSVIDSSFNPCFYLDERGSEATGKKAKEFF